MVNHFDIKRQLEASGIVLLSKPESNERILELASSLGKVLPDNKGNIFQSLKARPNGMGPKGSFTNVLGFGEFPWHTDTAFWSIPARYLLLTSLNESQCATNYCHFKDVVAMFPEIISLTQKALFEMHLPSGISVVPMQFKINGETGWRYDEHIMKPYNRQAKDVANMIHQSLKNPNLVKSIHWTGENIAIIDNWFGIHNRGECDETEQRELIRIYIL